MRDSESSRSDNSVRETVPPSDENVGVLPLHTPADAARILAIRESWLRRAAGERRIPATYIGRHLRFSRADIAAIAADGARPAQLVPRRCPTESTTRPPRRMESCNSPDRRTGRNRPPKRS
ncbi:MULTISPECIES: helix-turn-helix domain-containing protein [Pseudonocardia]|uniref:DNA-binding protein n=1 Tax=Pseudonocardia saturnea TaxID=33909 RepID=A0ABQ0RZL8_9PSEU|nr:MULTISPECIES: helix-turn-helix domain-containing protein [Pseudonocardia]BBG02798.1 DNA-binding protein [Pseudonocardia autotrophica]GEC26117.1 DNA-binding protein [Pseudonocardia saturnea]